MKKTRTKAYAGSSISLSQKLTNVFGVRSGRRVVGLLPPVIVYATDSYHPVAGV